MILIFLEKDGGEIKLENFLNILKRNRLQYVIAISLVATVILINSLVDFADRIIKNSFLSVLSAIIFIFFVIIPIKEEIWKNEK
ncbi:MAG: hypothetical protein AABX90_00515 [Nanoarchaeota archaeon]